MATNNFFGYTSHGEASYASPNVAAPPAGYAAAPAAAAVARAAPVPAAAAYARFPAAAAQAAPGYRAASAATVAYSVYQPAAAPPAPFASSSSPMGGTPVVTAASYPAPNSYPGYPTATPGPQVAAQAPVPAQPQQRVFDGRSVAAAAAATYYPRAVSVAAPTFSMSAGGGPHFQARPLYSATTSLQVQAPPTVMSVGPGAAAATNRPPAPSSYSSIYSQSSSTPSYTYPAAPNNLANLKPHALYPGLAPVTAGHQAVATVSTANWQAQRMPITKISAAAGRQKPRPPPKPLQLHYCEVCKISCAGPQTYKEHLEGQKHRKKEAANKALANGNAAKSNAASKSGMSNLRCELCDVTCTGSDAYAAHIRGAKHSKVVKLHSKLGKPIPSIDPVVVSTGIRKAEEQLENRKYKRNNADWNDAKEEEEKEIMPVGGDYIEEVKSENGKTVSFNCKLCDCKFNDPNAKIMHMKGRRHRLQYKKKVDPELVVDMKPSLRKIKLTPEEQQAKHKLANEEFWKRREEEFRAIEEEEKSYWEERGPKVELQGLKHPLGFGPMLIGPETIDDRHVAAKHREIYPSEDELSFIQKHVSSVEKSLKLVSDAMQSDSDKQRCLKGVMRVGILAKGLLLKGDETVELVVLCEGKPTHSILDYIVETLPSKLESSETETYSVTKNASNAALCVSVNQSGCVKLVIKVTVTSPLMREDSGESSGDVLAKDKCLEALASLRHAKWFQARASGRQSCIMVIRVLRDLCRTVSQLKSVRQFTMELLVEKVLASAPVPLSPGDAVRRVFESIACGLLLPNSPGLLDPCEREPRDASDNLNAQEREEITAYSQLSLRLMAFRQIHRVLDMDPIPPPRHNRSRVGRKRKLDDENDEEGVEDEDDEEEVKKLKSEAAE